MDKLQIKLLSKDATMPERKYKTDAGLDIFAAENQIIRNNETKVIKTDVAVNIPKGYEGTIRPRSGKSSETSLRVVVGTIDAHYIGPIGVICDCHHKDPYVLVKKGEKIAQLVISPVVTPKVEVVEDFNIETERGEKGFGSSDEEAKSHEVIISEETGLETGW